VEETSRRLLRESDDSIPDAEAAAGTRPPARSRPRGGQARYRRVYGCRVDRNTRAWGSRARLRARFRVRRVSMRSWNP